ncbi:uncharacterized protein TNCV_3790911 [Trichonephila clavipes]|nr:uncharacterized protein TNCV_3790911 [Trichonephila clavipes]
MLRSPTRRVFSGTDRFAAATRGLLGTDHVILNHGQVTWTTPELAPPLLTTTPHQREDVSALDRFNVHRCPTRRVFSGTGLEPWRNVDRILMGPKPHSCRGVQRAPLSHRQDEQKSCTRRQRNFPLDDKVLRVERNLNPFIALNWMTVDDSLFLGTWTDKQSSIPYHDVCDAGLDFVGFFSLRSDMSAIWLW